MNKKALVIIALAAVIALSCGIIAVTTANSDRNKKADASDTPASSTENAHDPDDQTQDPQSDPSGGSADITEHVLPTRGDETIVPSVPFEEQLISAEFKVQDACDHVTGEAVSPRVVLGESHSYCYVRFGDDGRFEMCLDPSSGTVQSGNYHIYGSVVSVEYDNGVGSEYDIITDESGSITCLIVNYGDYDIYFG